MTLMEMMAALLVMVLLVMGMGTGMDAGMRVYRDSQFETDSAVLADILNTSMSDLLRYAEDVKPSTATPEGIEFVFTNAEFGVLDGYFQMSEQDATGSVQLKNLRDSSAVDLVNAGAYPDLKIANLHVIYAPENETAITIPGETNATSVSRGGFFYITYDILSKVDTAKSRTVETVVRQMNTH